MAIPSKNGNTSMKFQNTSIVWQVKPSQPKSTRTFIIRRSWCSNDYKDKSRSLKVSKECWKMRNKCWGIRFRLWRNKMPRWRLYKIAIRQEPCSIRANTISFTKNTGSSTMIIKKWPSNWTNWRERTKESLKVRSRRLKISSFLFGPLLKRKEPFTIWRKNTWRSSLTGTKKGQALSRANAENCDRATLN